ncbi:uncharacterized protein LOC141627896 [Silene latifolia]|uniref:uncharacterized protein LOC141627896 n=1 Tax=Silene latifolia TaxID=37657 RepID=UPI003D773BCC
MKKSLHEIHSLLVQAEKDMGLSDSMRKDALAINVKGNKKFKRNGVQEDVPFTSDSVMIPSEPGSWNVVGKDVIKAIQSVFRSGQLLKQCNNTLITLVPKKNIPDNVLQFGPLPICNTIYKCLSKKAYDYIEWSFVEEMLRALDFPEMMVSLLMQCVTTPSYSIALNGEKMQNFRFHPLCKRIGLTHLCFADDLILFCKGDRASIELMINAFHFFSKASGLKLNKEKSNFYANGVDEGLLKEVEVTTGMCRGSVPFKYLGVTVSPKRLSIGDCTCLVDNVIDRIKGMGTRHLSYAGRVVLIKDVLSTLHNYWGRIFILPKTVIKRIEAVCRDFLWHGREPESSPALVAWERVFGKYVWWIENKEDHLWVKWVHAIYIKGKVWKDYSSPINSSWAWRKICQTKNILKDCIWNQNTGYSIKMGYDWLVPVNPIVTWYPWSLNNWIMPKHGFICWLAAQGHLLTQDRLNMMHISQTNCCYLCGLVPENHDHLFFLFPRPELFALVDKVEMQEFMSKEDSWTDFGCFNISRVDG